MAQCVQRSCQSFRSQRYNGNSFSQPTVSKQPDTKPPPSWFERCHGNWDMIITASYLPSNRYPISEWFSPTSPSWLKWECLPCQKVKIACLSKCAMLDIWCGNLLGWCALRERKQRESKCICHQIQSSAWRPGVHHTVSSYANRSFISQNPICPWICSTARLKMRSLSGSKKWPGYFQRVQHTSPFIILKAI